MYGKRDAAAATVVDRLELARDHAEGLERRVAELELDVHRQRVRLNAPRYRLVDSAIGAVRAIPGLHQVVRLAWRLVTGGRGGR